MPRFLLPFITAIVWGCLLVGVTVHAQSEQSYFLGGGEGLTAASESSGMELGFRWFTLPNMPAECASAPMPDRLIVREDLHVVTVGELFSISDVTVLAVDAAGSPLPPTPITVAIWGDAPGLVVFVDREEYLRTGQTDLLDQCCDALALRPGTVHVRIRTDCAEPGRYQPDPPSCIEVFRKHCQANPGSEAAGTATPSCVESFSPHCKEVIFHYRVKAK